jgi:LPS sulfotransferase NodH
MLECIKRSFTIAFTVRSGSNAVCDLLERNGLGAPNEWFQCSPDLRPDETRLSAFSRLVCNRQVNGTFGSKMAHHHRAATDEWMRESLPHYRRLDDVLPNHKWIQLVRRDKVLQAISLCRAESSGTWAAAGSPDSAGVDLEYDFFEILSRLMMIQSGELAWDLYFQQNQISPLVIVYEDFFRDMDVQLSRLIDYLGGLPDGRTALQVDPSFKVQRDDMTNSLREQFISDFVQIGESSLTKKMGEPWNRWTRFFLEYQWRKSEGTAA